MMFMWTDTDDTETERTARGWAYFERHGGRVSQWNRLLSAQPSIWRRLGPALTWAGVIGSWLVL
jgi:hypothetical protein